MVKCASAWVCSAIGLAIYMVFRSTMALGANLQRFSMQRELKKSEDERVPMKKQRLLYLGVVLYAGSGVLLSTALIFASPTLLSPCGTIIFVANAFFATKLNKEPFSWRKDGACIGLIILGSIAVVLSAPKTGDGDLTNDKLIWLCQQPSFIIFLSCLFAFVILMWRAPRILKRSGGTDVPGWRRNAMYISRGALAGSLGACNITFTKSLFSLFGGEISKGGIVAVLKDPFMWFLGLVLAVFYVSQMTATTRGLKVTPAMIFVPTQSVVEETGAALGGLFYYQDYTRFTLPKGIVYAMGVLCTVTAVIMLARLQIARQDRASAGGVLDVEASLGAPCDDAESRSPIRVPRPSGASRTSISSIEGVDAGLKMERPLLSHAHDSDHEPYTKL